MKSLAFLVVLATLQGSAQSDSLKKLRFSAFQLKLNMLGTTYRQTSQEQFQTFVKDNEILNRDISGYETQKYSRVSNYSSFISLNGVMMLNTQMKFPKIELVFGLSYGESVLSSSSYSKVRYDTTSIYYNANNDILVTVDEISSNYYYHLNTKQLLMPVGINFTTRQERRIWLSAGIEISPGVSFSSVFSATHDTYTSELILNKASVLSDRQSYTWGSFHRDGRGENATTTLKGIGFTSYVNLPLSANIRLSKRIIFLKHLSLSVAICPGIYYNSNRFLGTNTSLIMNSSFGLRYSL